MNLPLRLFKECLAALACMVLLVQPGFADTNESLGAGDSVRVTVFENPDLTTETRISNQGMITFPLIGEIKLAGLTPAVAGTYIAKRLKDAKFLADPQVTVSVLQLRSRQVSVLGQVVRPGRYVLDDTSSHLSDILAQAGGIAATGDETVTVMVTRNDKPSKLEINLATMYRTGDLTNNIELQNGDTVFVERAPVFYIYGEVQHGGAYRLEPNMSVMQALALGGGVTLRGSDDGIKIHRHSADGKLTKINVGLYDKVQPDDVIYISESWF